MKIVLASSSPYRTALLRRVLAEFELDAPHIDESAHPNEPPAELARRLAIAKAQAIASRHPQALIIGSDQVAWLEQEVLGKPQTKAQAITQLAHCQGKTAQFYTGLCLLNSKTGKTQVSVEVYETTFRSLSDQQLANYVEREPAYDCAGGFKMEGLGIALFEKISGDDPNILIGLPLIRLIDMLNNEGISIL